MKTSLVVKEFDGRFRRACTPTDGGPQNDVPSYMPAHRAKGSAWRNGKHVSEWPEPERVSTRYCGFRPKRGKVVEIRYLRPDIVEQLHKIDEEQERLRQEINKLHREQQDLLRMTFENGRCLTVAEAKAWREERQAAKA